MYIVMDFPICLESSIYQQIKMMEKNKTKQNKTREGHLGGSVHEISAFSSSDDLRALGWSPR